MPKTSHAALADAIEHALTNGLVHPGTGDGPIALPLPMFNNDTIPDEMRRHFNEDAGLPPHATSARLVAEALASALDHAGNTAGAEQVRQAADPTGQPAPTKRPTKTTPPPAAPPQPAAPQTPSGGQHPGSMTVTLNGETIMTELADLKRFSADVQPGSRPPLWKKVLIMAALDGVTHHAHRRIDITTTDNGEWTMHASPHHATDSS